MTVTDKPLDVLVVGAGIAGLSAAIALGKQGHRVVVRSQNSANSCHADRHSRFWKNRHF
jgi:2-polyprenyl-6-methoxyphenol hydroxylase-like FAD-dependent oxidoreductase